MTRRFTLTLAAALAVVGALSMSAWAGSSSATSPVTAVTGSGSGSMVVAMSARAHGTFVGEITANIQGAGPNTTFTVQRALDPTPTGTCDSLGSYDVQGTLTVNGQGSGAAHLQKESQAPTGFTFDVLFQFVGSDGSLLQSNCMTLTVK